MLHRCRGRPKEPVKHPPGLPPFDQGVRDPASLALLVFDPYPLTLARMPDQRGALVEREEDLEIEAGPLPDISGSEHPKGEWCGEEDLACLDMLLALQPCLARLDKTLGLIDEVQGTA